MRHQDHDVEVIQWRRLALIIGLSGLVGAFLLWLPSLAKPQQTEPQWETIIDEGFDGPFPGAGWRVVDNSETDGGEYYWGRETFTRTGEVTYTQAITAIWSVGDGDEGNTLEPGVSSYPENIDSWTIYGPFDVGTVFDGELTFDWWLDTASGPTAQANVLDVLQATTAPESGDWFGWCVLQDENDLEDCQGSYVSGSTSRWMSGTLSLKPYAQLSRVTTETQPIWIAFHFLSDDDGRVGLGAFVDNVVLRVNKGYDAFLPLAFRQPTPTPTNTPTPTPTPTPAALDYVDHFDNPLSGWTLHTASSGLSGCDSSRQHLDYKYSLFYEGGRYKVNIPLDCRAGGSHGDTRHIYPVNFAPGIKRPAARTCVGVRGSLERWDSFWSFFGLVFAASDDRSTVYTLEVNNLGDWAIIKRTDYKYPGPNHPFENETRENVKPDTGYTGGRREPAEPAFEANRLVVEIGTNELKFFINNQQVYRVIDPWIVNEVRSLRSVGLMGGDWEITPTQIGFDYFFVDEGCDTY